jgi:hypothetical protein
MINKNVKGIRISARLRWIKSNELESKTRMLRKLIKYYPSAERTYLYHDFYKLTNFTIEYLLKQKEGDKK